MTGQTARSLRWVGCVRLLVGAASLVTLNRDDVPVIEGQPPRVVVAARLLAVRDVTQGAALVFAPEQHLDRLAQSGAAVDILHAASMLPLIIGSRRYRSAAALSAVSAVTWVAATIAAQQSQSRLLRRSRIQR